jgi:hypothetical protein
MNADRSTSPLARVRWGNVVRLLALPTVVLLVVCWPRLSTRAPRLPDATARPITVPAPPPAPPATSHRRARAPHPRPRPAPRRHRAAARPSAAPRAVAPVPPRAPRAVMPALAPAAGEFDLESGG